MSTTLGEAARRLRRSSTRVAAGDWSTARWALRNLARSTSNMGNLAGDPAELASTAGRLCELVSDIDQDELARSMRDLAARASRMSREQLAEMRARETRS